MSTETCKTSVGPWAFGYFDDYNFGILFQWGLVIDGKITPPDVTHFYALFDFFPVIVVLIIGLALKRSRRPNESFYWLKTNAWFIAVMLLQIFHCVEFYLYFGILASFLGICGFGRVIFVTYLWIIYGNLHWDLDDQDPQDPEPPMNLRNQSSGSADALTDGLIARSHAL